VEGVAEFRIVQHTVQDIEVLVVPGAGWQETARASIEHGLRKRLGEDIRIVLRLVDAIPPETSGKYRYVVSEVPLPDSLKVAMQSPIN
jgi:phenylacetate-CoA ligase